MKTPDRKTASPHVVLHDQDPSVIRPIEKTELTLASSPAGLTRALVAVELTTLREASLVELPAQVLQALNLDALSNLDIDRIRFSRGHGGLRLGATTP